MKIRARMMCNSVERQAYGKAWAVELVKMSAVATDDPSDPNYTYSEATPAGSLELTVSNKDAHGAFQAGETYDISIEPTPSGESGG